MTPTLISAQPCDIYITSTSSFAPLSGLFPRWELAEVSVCVRVWGRLCWPPSNLTLPAITSRCPSYKGQPITDESVSLSHIRRRGKTKWIFLTHGNWIRLLKTVTINCWFIRNSSHWLHVWKNVWRGKLWGQFHLGLKMSSTPTGSHVTKNE